MARPGNSVPTSAQNASGDRRVMQCYLDARRFDRGWIRGFSYKGPVSGLMAALEAASLGSERRSAQVSRTRMTVPLEEVRVGDLIDGRRVVEVLHRTSVRFVRIILAGGWPVVQGYVDERKTVTIERDEKGSG